MRDRVGVESEPVGPELGRNGSVSGWIGTGRPDAGWESAAPGLGRNRSARSGARAGRPEAAGIGPPDVEQGQVGQGPAGIGWLAVLPVVVWLGRWKTRSRASFVGG